MWRWRLREARPGKSVELQQSLQFQRSVGERPGGRQETAVCSMDIAGAVRSLLKREEISIDGLVFKLHYRVTVVILVTASMIGVAKQVRISLHSEM